MVTASPTPLIIERLLLFTLAAVQFTHIMDFMIMMPLGSTLMGVFKIEPDQFAYPRAGFVSLACFGLTYFLAFRLRAAAPHAARPGHVTVAPALD